MHASLRFVFRISFLVVVLSILLVMTECSQPGGIAAHNPSDINNVGTISPSAMIASGATTVPANLKDTFTALSSISSNDLVLSDLGTSLSAIGNSLSSSGSGTKSAAIFRALSTFKGIVRKDLSSDITSQLGKISTDIQNFPTSKSLNETISLSGNSLGQYVKLTTATCAFSASVVTTDGGPLDTTNETNFKSATGEGTLSIVVDPQNLPSSAIKDFKLRVNAGVSLALGATTVNGTVEPANLVFDYAESAVLALSFSQGGTGGKIVMTANAKNKGTIADPTTLGENGNSAALAPDITVTISVYNDIGNQTFTQTWTDLASLETSISALSP